MSPPTRQRRLHTVLQFRLHIEEGRRPRAAVQVLVGAAQREVGVAGRKLHRCRAGRMGKIPYCERTLGMGLGGHCLHVVQPRGAVIHLGDHGEGHALVDRLHHLLGIDDLQHIAVIHQVAEALRNIEVGRKIAVVRQDHPALGGKLGGSTQQLEQVHRDRVAGNDTAGRRADKARNAVADLLRQLEPAMLVP